MDKLDKSTILNAFRSEELNHQHHTQVESLNQVKAGSRGGYKGKGWFQKHKEHKEHKEFKEFKNMSQVLCYICQELSHMLHNCPRVQDRKVKGSESAKKAESAQRAMIDDVCYNQKVSSYVPCCHLFCPAPQWPGKGQDKFLLL